MTHPYLPSILATLDALIRQAQKYTPGGVLLPEDMAGLYRRAAATHGCTPDDLQRWHGARGAEAVANG